MQGSRHWFYTSLKMEKTTIIRLNKTFEEYACEEEGVEYWLARELQELLGYAEWRNFSNAVDKAKESCKTAGVAVSDHFVDVNKMIGNRDPSGFATFFCFINRI